MGTRTEQVRGAVTQLCPDIDSGCVFPCKNRDVEETYTRGCSRVPSMTDLPGITRRTNVKFNKAVHSVSCCSCRVKGRGAGPRCVLVV